MLDPKGVNRGAPHVNRGAVSRFRYKYFELLNLLRFNLRSSQERSKMSLHEKIFVIMTIITFIMALSCLTHLDEDL
jgi:hypothetical protein